LNEHPDAGDFVLEPADNPRLANLCGQFDEHLRQLERRLGVEISNRGNTFRVIGDTGSVRAAGEMLKTLYAEAQAAVLTPARVNLLLHQVQAPPAPEWAPQQEPDEPELVIRTRRSIVKGRGFNQQRYLRNILKHDISFGVGPAGTGKTYLAVASAVDALEREQVSRVLLVRPAVEAGERLGFLPGDLVQKIDPYLRPLYDALYEMLGFDRVAQLVERNVIELAPLAFMRGRTLNDAFVILDEAQNTTVEQMKMFLTRIGFGSKAVVTGDITQIDLPRDRPSGLRQVIDVLKEVEDISFTFFQTHDVVRHPLVQRIVAAYQEHEQKS
jgi:phosphate starvation-inducible protein PhoH and related proteins